VKGPWDPCRGLLIAVLGTSLWFSGACGHASRFISGVSAPQKEQPIAPQEPSGFEKRLEQFLLQLHRSLDVQEVADTAACDGHLLLRCDRLSVVVKRGRKASVRAVSGQTNVHARANLIKAMTTLSRQVMHTGESLLFNGGDSDLPPQLEQPLADYLRESGSTKSLVAPLFETQRAVHSDDATDTPQKRAPARKVLGCLLAEQISDSKPLSQLEPQAELLAEHVGAAVFNAARHQRIPMLRLWTSLGSSMEWFHGRKLAIAMAVLVITFVCITSLIVVPWDYRITAEGRVMPETQVVIFAPWQGEIDKLHVEGGDVVRRGQVLLELKNEELLEQYEQAAVEVRQNVQMVESAASQINLATDKMIGNRSFS